MSDEIISKENLSKELIKDVFESAYFDVSVDEQYGDLILKEQYRYFVEVDEHGRFVNFRCNLQKNEDAPLEDRHKFVNDVNNSLIAIRVAETPHAYSFDQYMWLEGGVTRKNVVLAFKFFTSLVDSAVSKATEGIFA